MPNTLHAYVGDVCTYKCHTWSHWYELFNTSTVNIFDIHHWNIWLPHPKYSSHGLLVTWAYRPNHLQLLLHVILPNMCQTERCPSNGAYMPIFWHAYLGYVCAYLCNIRSMYIENSVLYKVVQAELKQRWWLL